MDSLLPLLAHALPLAVAIAAFCIPERKTR